MTEINIPQPNFVSDRVNSKIVIDAFMLAINNPNRQRGPKPARIERIFSAFKGRESEAVPLEDFEKAFSDTADPENSATSAIGGFNRILESLGINLEIKRSSYYQFTHKKHNTSPEWQNNLPIESITLETSLENIPVGPRCPQCGIETKKVFLDFHHIRGRNLVVRATNVAGYRCPNECEYESYSHQAIIESLNKAKDVFLARGDEETAKVLGWSKLRQEELLAEEQRALPWLFADNAQK